MTIKKDSSICFKEYAYEVFDIVNVFKQPDRLVGDRGCYHFFANITLVLNEKSVALVIYSANFKFNDKNFNEDSLRNMFGILFEKFLIRFYKSFEA